MQAINQDMQKVFMCMGHAYGMKETHMKLLSVLYLEPDYVTADDLAKKTGYSLASVSLTVRILEDLGILSHKKKPGAKKLYYLLEKDLFLIHIKKFEAAQRNFIAPAKKMLPEMVKSLKLKPGKYAKEQLKIIEKLYKQMLKMEMLMQEWQEDLEENRDA